MLAHGRQIHLRQRTRVVTRIEHRTRTVRFWTVRNGPKNGLVERRALVVADRPKSGDVETVGQHTPDGPPKYGTIPHL